MRLWLRLWLVSDYGSLFRNFGAKVSAIGRRQNGFRITGIFGS